MLEQEVTMNVTAVHELIAFNTAVSSDNKIHDDSVARQFGFRGGLVPGVEVYAYMAHMPVARWGRLWLESGQLDCRFQKPVYDGAVTQVTAKDDNNQLVLGIESGGEHCATGRAWIAADRRFAPGVDTLPAQPAPASRPPASEVSLAPGRALGIAPVILDRAMLAQYIEDIRETDPIYLTEGLVHPGQILRLANAALVQNVILGPWVHVGSKVHHHAAARLGQELTLRSTITSNTVSKGHAIVDFDAVVIADGKICVAEITHVAIWRPRQASEGSPAAK
jgi:acyl dehydratase